VLPVEAFEVRKRLSTLSLAKPRYNSEAVLNTSRLFMYGDTYDAAKSFCKPVLNVVKPYFRL
jgi:hypothetical protein